MFNFLATPIASSVKTDLATGKLQKIWSLYELPTGGGIRSKIIQIFSAVVTNITNKIFRLPYKCYGIKNRRPQIILVNVPYTFVLIASKQFFKRTPRS